MRTAFVKHFSIESKARENNNDVFEDAVDDTDTTQQNIEATREKIDKLQVEKENQRQVSRTRDKEQIYKMLTSPSGEVDDN